MTDWRREAQADPEDAAAAMRVRLAEERRGAPGRFAVFGDVCGNLEALSATLADISARQVREVYCLGRPVSVGPDPAACLDLLLDSHVRLLRSPHTQELLEPQRIRRLPIFRQYREALEFSAASLRVGTRAQTRLAALDSAPLFLDVSGFRLLFGTPLEPIGTKALREIEVPARGALFPAAMRRFLGLERGAITAASQPFVLTSQHDLKLPANGDAASVCLKGGRKALVGAGAVGDPQSSPPRAWWLEVSTSGSADCELTWRSLDYDASQTAAKIRGSRRIPSVFADAFRWS